MSVPTLLLIDGHSAVYRAFYGIRGLSTSDGTPTNAVFGFIRMMRAVRRAVQPTHCVVVFDAGRSEKRQELLPEYKAQRSPMPDDLSRQIPLVQEYLDACPVPRLGLEGVEGDDVIASMRKVARRQEAEVVIVGSDKDFYQLVDEHTVILPSSNLEDKMGAHAVMAKTGVLPEHIVPWLALMGDQSDNIPGVPGVGAKTAAKLLQQYGGLDAIWEELDSVMPQRIQDALRECRTDVERNIELVTLSGDVDCPLTWAEMELAPEGTGVLPLLYRLELRTLARELEEPELL